MTSSRGIPYDPDIHGWCKFGKKNQIQNLGEQTLISIIFNVGLMLMKDVT